MAVSVYVCVMTRDGNIRNDVLSAVFQSASDAHKAGIKVDVGRQQYAYGVATGRNMAVAKFLKTGYSHLLFVDDDVILPEETIRCLAETAAKPNRDIVCGAYPSLKFITPTTAYLYITMLPAGYKNENEWLRDYPTDETEIAAAGTGCMLINRRLLEMMGHPWFQWPEKWDRENGTVESISDDMAFCDVARQLGFRIWADGRVRCGHLKLVDLSTLLNGRLKWFEEIPNPQDGYGSHRPVLAAVARKMEIRSVLEFGAGRYSTPFFLDRKVFPHLERMVSFENNQQWAADVRHNCKDDRLTVQHCELSDMPVSGGPADLVFIDCDVSAGDRHDYSARVKLIERYQTDQTAKVVVVHDANFASINPAVMSSTYPFKAIYRPASGPHTALLSTQVDVRKLLESALSG